MNILINVANLHVGGGVQVASSFLTELSQIIASENIRSDITINVLCSDVVNDNLPKDFDYTVFKSFSLVNVYGFRRPKKCVIDLFNGYDVCFTLFGPLYFQPRCKKHVCGFAQAWISYPKNIASRTLSTFEKIKCFIRFEMQWAFFNLPDRLVVEQQHVKDSLISNRNYPSDKIDIAFNCVSGVFLSNETCWMPINHSLPEVNDTLTIGYLGRAYSHKNLSILSSVNTLLMSKYKMKIRFLFSLSDEDMKLLEFDVIPNFYTVGSLNIAQCPSFYQMIDGLVFPSLLECFSATPIEAMLMKVPVFASDLPFVKDVCKETVFYFDPLEPEDIAKSIYQGFTEQKALNENVEAAFSLAITLPSAKDRTLKYLDILSQ